MRTRDLLCALALLASAAPAASDCLPWQEGPKPAGVAGEEAARKYLRDAVREHPSDTQLHARLGQMLFDTQCYELALSELLRARRLGERSPDLLLRLASAENILGAFRDAAADAGVVSAILEASAGQRASAAALAGLAFESAGQDDSAIARFQESLKLAPQLENSALMLAGLLAKKGLNAEAAATLEGFVARNPSSAEAWARLADLQSALGNPARAVACWNKVRQLAPDYPMLDSMLAQAMLAGEHPDFPAVLRVLERAKLKTPEDSDVFYLEGKTLAAMGRYPEAAKTLQAAIRIQPLQSNLHYQLGLVYRKSGQTDLAREQFEIMSHLRSGQQGR